MIYERHNFLNKDISYLINTEILEYDIKSAGFNIVKRFDLLPESKVRYLEKLSKKERQVTIGLWIRNNKQLAVDINNSFIATRKEFFKANELTEDDILSIKKDAIFTLKRCHELEFDSIIFDEKNFYSSYFYLNKKEFYFNSFANKLDVKGISETNLEKHRPYILDFLSKFFRLLEMSDTENATKRLKQFANYYREKTLHVGYYRELSADSTYVMKNDEIYKNRSVLLDNVDNDFIDMLNINHNYICYVIPLLNILI
jgi:hypothetical protein